MSADTAAATDRNAFRCTHCAQYLGDVLGPDRLRINGIVFPVRRSKQLICPSCNQLVIWYAREAKGLDNRPAGVQE
jgi:hypothetical protein